MDPFHHLNSSFSNPYHPLLASPPHHFAPDPLPPPPPPLLPDPPPSSSADRERLPQWSHAETAAFLAIRADLDHSFLSTKRNKALWEAAAARLHALGFSRTPDQCKSKWKNLVTRFKGTEGALAVAPDQIMLQGGAAAARGASTAASPSSFPFHDELRRIFDARVERARALERKKVKGKEPDEQDDGGGEGDEEDDEEAEQAEEDDGDGASGDTTRSGSKKRRRKAVAAAAAARRTSGSGGVEGEVEAMLREFMRRQLEMEERWMEAAEAREAERRAREEEWRTAMVALGEERLALVRRWREREDAWRARAEEREERRHQLVAALLAKLNAGDASA
ncbi:trihelix transcription factor GT-3b-like [Oryza brachyantha]|uniref:trihelix transcription factor GT-3b-like n=1 Tax=Oryza brachyantha TaxID=4533 RepID=UPI001ADC0FD0|nr:trihelix transcription factor GT-3b-like [Oryza brachyantha]